MYSNRISLFIKNSKSSFYIFQNFNITYIKLASIVKIPFKVSAPGTVQGLLDTCCSISRSYPDIHQKFRLWFRSQILWETQRKLKRLKLTTSNHIKIIPFQIDFLLLHPPENIAFRGNRSQTMVWNGLNYLFKELWENESKYQADRKIIVVVSKMRWLKIWA